jgi:cellulose synthase/poly-beta-1,6-N-acetylglucosamine synthase-like glycosyltransferase
MVILIDQAALLAVAVYYLLIAFGGLWPFPEGERSPTELEGSPRFLCLTMAHNEEAVIGEHVRNLLAMDYPRSSFDVVVVADNCSDRTSEIASAEGAVVWRRHNIESSMRRPPSVNPFSIISLNPRPTGEDQDHDPGFYPHSPKDALRPVHAGVRSGAASAISMAVSWKDWLPILPPLFPGPKQLLAVAADLAVGVFASPLGRVSGLICAL